MIFSSIHKKLARNLLVSAIVIGILTGLSVTLIELRRIDRYVLKIASDDSQILSKYYLQYHNDRTDSTLTILRQAIQDKIGHDSFIFIKLLDENSQIVAKESIKEFDKTAPNVLSKFNDFNVADKSEYHNTVYFEDQLYIQAMAPIYDNHEKNIIGYFEGIYHLPDKKTVETKKQSYYSILLSIVVVVTTTVFIYPIVHNLYSKLLKRSLELIEANTNILKSLGSAIAKRDDDTNSHNYRVTILSVKLAEKIGLSRSQIRSLIKGAFLHDVGKIGISDTILLKPGKLTHAEFEIMKQHVVLGVEIVQDIDWLKDAVEVIQYHHEKMDGSGYVSGIKDKDIPINAKLFAIADVFDALTSERPYKKAFSFKTSIKIMKEDSGSHFDPELLKNFEQIAETLYTEISNLENKRQLNKQLDLLVNKYFVYFR
ncbi:MAG: HD-GYP domain-containing protein [Deltaproteobacteria bacterium]|nr:HD-GYP domain-containing protein [Deltaproteobacteria bacterium]